MNEKKVKVPGLKPIKSTEGKKFNEKDLIKDVKALSKACWRKEFKTSVNKTKYVDAWGCKSEVGVSKKSFTTRSEAAEYLDDLCEGTPYRKCFKVIRVSIKEIK